ncbi:hypothetical protein M9H77_31058 [Catharanthus roseus]|uniref:Uncharacterized protein n=1 Tax=Catharanthus roseus TaxID=4058 RepID=A0ACB9ZZY7_CATRO|nr:hypothetical protein M9H77_31058 [Catharanthus roseus]
MSGSRPSTRWSRFSMCASTTPVPSSTRVRRDSKLVVRSLDFPLGFGITESRCSSRLRPSCDDSTLVIKKTLDDEHAKARAKCLGSKDNPEQHEGWTLLVYDTGSGTGQKRYPVDTVMLESSNNHGEGTTRTHEDYYLHGMLYAMRIVHYQLSTTGEDRPLAIEDLAAEWENFGRYKAKYETCSAC